MSPFNLPGSHPTAMRQASMNFWPSDLTISSRAERSFAASAHSFRISFFNFRGLGEEHRGHDGGSDQEGDNRQQHEETRKKPRRPCTKYVVATTLGSSFLCPGRIMSQENALGYASSSLDVFHIVRMKPHMSKNHNANACNAECYRSKSEPNLYLLHLAARIEAAGFSWA